MRSILLHIHDDECLEARLQVALDLGRSFGGHLDCLHATPFEVEVPGDLYATMAAQILPEIRRASDALRERVEQRLAGEHVAWSWIQEDGLAAERIIGRSGLSDVIVVGSCDPYSEGPSDLPGAIAIRARTPVLIVPRAVDGFDCSRPALVAWDGSPEACRALRAATPLLARSQQVLLLTVARDSDERRFDLHPTQGAEYLSRHGIGCEVVERLADNRPIAQVLAEAAAQSGAAFMVMGAYGHTRLTEMIWGGVTRELFARPPLPIFACH